MQRLANRDVTRIGFEIADEIERRVQLACAGKPELKEALMDYSLSYADSFFESRGKLPTEMELKSLASSGADVIHEETQSLPANIKTKEFEALADMPMCRAPHLEKMFGENDRLYYKLEMEKPETLLETESRVAAFLDHHGYEVDFETRKATKDGKNHMRVGRLLGKLDNPDLQADWAESTGQYMKNGMIVISRNPEDIARASTGRSWSSCMDENYDREEPGFKVDHKGEDMEHAYHLKQDIEHGSCVAYLTTMDDPALMEPESRMFIKPYYNDKGEVAVLGNTLYGAQIEAFEGAIDGICAKQNQGLEGGFRMDLRLYDDDKTAVYIGKDGEIHELSPIRDSEHLPSLLPENLRTGNCTAEELLGYFDIKTRTDKNGQVHVDQEVDLIGLGIEKLPDMSHIQVNHDVTVSHNPITSLEGLPACQRLGCGDTLIKNLEGVHPNTDTVSCGYNKELTSLEGLPEGVREINCNESAVESFKGLPDSIETVMCNNVPATDFDKMPEGTQVTQGVYTFTPNPVKLDLGEDTVSTR